MANAWETNWVKVQQLGAGGQGTTYEVHLKGDPSTKGVLKLLNTGNAQEEKARRRMHNEVSQLQLLDGIGGKVPRVLESNTHAFANLGEELYFVMEFIEGATLTKVMEQQGPLPPELAIGLAIDLAETVRGCHAKSVMHRDLKPDNILIRSLDPADAVIVDCGLSFNEKEAQESNLTSFGEGVGNGFTNLPERRTPDAQRHYQSDITAVCGILYYCITGQEPKPFRDAHNNPPHRRTHPHLSLSAAMKGHTATKALELVLDHAFEARIVDRLERAEDLVYRLSQCLHPEPRSQSTSLADILKSGTETLAKSSRRVQLYDFKLAAVKVKNTITREAAKHQTGSHLRLLCIPAHGDQAIQLPEPFTFIHVAFGIVLQHVGVKESSVVEYAFAAQGGQAVLLRRRLRPSQDSKAPQMGGGLFSQPRIPSGMSLYLYATLGQNFEKVEEWTPRIYYPGNGAPEDDEVLNEVRNCVEWQVAELANRLNG